jgi:hypothetical protein
MKLIYPFLILVIIAELLFLSCNNSGKSNSISDSLIENSTSNSIGSGCPTPDRNCASSNPYDSQYSLPSVLFPTQSDPWYQPIDSNSEVDKNSALIIAHHIGTNDTNSRGSSVLVECSLPYNVINSKMDNVSFIEIKGISDDRNADNNTDNDYDDPSGIKRIPFSESMRMQNGHWEGDPKPEDEKQDHHLIIYDKGTNLLYEVYQLRKQKVGKWDYGHKGLAIYNLNSERPRNVSYPTYHTSADAAGLAILPGLVRMDESNGEINHALRITFSGTFQGYVYPGTHYTTTGPNEGLFLPMGARLRLKKNFNDSALTPKAQRIVRCLKKYGAIVADNGTPFAISATDDCAFNNQMELPGYRCSTGGNSFHLCADVQFEAEVKWGDFEVMKLHDIVTAHGSIKDSDGMLKKRTK